MRLVAGDVAFAVRFERFFTELRDPLFALYGDDPRFAAAWERLLRAIAATAAERSDELRVLDHEREITPDWLQREQAVGYVTYVDRFAGTLAGVREQAALPARAGRDVPAPDAAAARAARAQRRRLRGRRLRRRSSPRWGRSTICARWPPTCARPGWRCASTSCSTTPRPSTRGRPRGPTSTARSRTGASPTRTSARCPTSSPTPRPGASRWVEDRLGLDDVQRLPVGPRLHEPRRVRGDGVGDARPGRGRRRRAAPGRGAVPVEAGGDELPEPARGPRAAAGLPGGAADRRARGRLQGRGDRRARATSSPTWGPAATRARSATSPTTTC